MSDCEEDLLTRRYPCRRPNPFRSVRDLGRDPVGCPCKSEASEGRSSVWLPTRLPTEHDAWHRDALVYVANIGLRLGPPTRRAGKDRTPTVFKSVRNSLSGSVATWVFSRCAHHFTQDHPVYIPRDLNCSVSCRHRRAISLGIGPILAGNAADPGVVVALVFPRGIAAAPVTRCGGQAPGHPVGDGCGAVLSWRR